RLGAFWIGLLRHLGGGENVRQEGNAAQVLLDPGLWPIALLAGAAVIWQWRRGNLLPGLLLAGPALVLPLFDGRFEVVTHGRYLAPLLPVLYAGVGALVAAGLERLGRERVGHPGLASGARRPGPICLALVVVFVTLHPLLYPR